MIQKGRGSVLDESPPPARQLPSPLDNISDTAHSMNIFKNKTAIVVTLGTAVTLLSLFLQSSVPGAFAGVLAGVFISQCSIGFLPRTPSDPLDQAKQELKDERREFERWCDDQTAAFQQQAQRIEERNRDLLERSARFLQFAEYPMAVTQADDSLVQLSEQDRRVNQLLEDEAERVYEKIRNNEYTVNGTVDIDRIRNDAIDLIHRVACVYSPESVNPLLETSFEQVARSASRICLHTLVLLEQLPLEVQKYNINELHGYVRKAVQGYGAYKQIAPWLKTVTRTAYVGRFAAGANPLTLGAWWLATELGRRGAAKVVESVVDRQAVAVLHDMIAVLGVEVANVYGPGYRHRDAAWIYGTELVELISSFPVSRESLSEALKVITQLPLRNEYDRIYLYRCVADNRSSGFGLSDPAVVSRKEREEIARNLEAFFHQYIHGATDDRRRRWQAGVESRLDLKLQFEAMPVSADTNSALESIESLHAFLVTIANVSPGTATSFVESSALMGYVPIDERSPLIKRLEEQAADAQFEPPGLDPSSPLTEIFLNAMSDALATLSDTEDHIEALMLEIAGYFRRSRAEATEMLHRSYLAALESRCTAASSVSQLHGMTARTILRHLNPLELLAAVYSDITVIGMTKPAVDPVLIAIHHADQESLNRILLLETGNEQALWESDQATIAVRQKRIFLDECELKSTAAHNSVSIRIGGSIRGGGYRSYFGPILSIVKSVDF